MCTCNCNGYCNVVGFRFSPSDDEILCYYLQNKMIGDDNQTRAIAEIDLCQFEPWELPQRSVIKSDNHMWYFFCRQDNKYSNGKRANRKTQQGFWKSTGQDRAILARGTDIKIGTKKTLVFHKGRVPHGIGTNWVIHEYRPDPATTPRNSRPYVLCRLEEKPVEKNSPSHIGDPGSSSASASNNNALAEGGPHLEVNTEQVVGNNELDYELAIQASMEANGLFVEDLLEPDGPSYDPNWMEELEPFCNDVLPNGFPVEQNVGQVQLDMDEQEEVEFVNSMLVDGDEFIYEETVNNHLHDYRPSRLCTRVYMDHGSETRTVMGNVQNQPHNSKGSCPNQMESDFNYEDVLILDTSSDDSAAATPFKHNSLELVQKDTSIDTRIFKSQYQPRPHDSLAEEGPKSFQLQCGSSSRNAASRDKGRKTQADLRRRSSQSTGSKTQADLRRRSSESTDSNRRGSSIFKEMPQSTSTPSPPSVYLFKVVLGVILFIAVVIELVSLH